MRWTDEQARAIGARGESLLLSAAAGSGKTTVLVECVLRLILDDGADIDRMLEELEKQFNSLLAEASAAGGTEDYAERFRMISNAMADLKEHKSRIKQVYQENELVSQRLKAASIAMSAYAAELTEWDQSVVYQLVEKVTVLAKDKIRVTFRNGTEVEQEIEQLDWRNAS